MAERKLFFPNKKTRSQHLFAQAISHLDKNQQIRKEFEIGQTEATVHAWAEYPELPIMVMLLTDPHFGSAGVDYRLLEDHLGTALYTPNFFVMVNGDDVDNFNMNVHPSGMLENPLPPSIQARAWEDAMKTFDDAGKLLAMGFGNHNDFTFDASGIDWYDSYLSQIHCPILTTGGLVNLTVNGGQRYDIAMAHRYWGNSKLNPTNMVKRYMEHEYPQADVIFLGHVHQSEGLHFERGGKDRVGVIGGTYKLKDSWARKRGIGGRAGAPGWVVALWPHQRQMQLYKDIHLARDEMYSMIHQLTIDPSWVDPYTRSFNNKT